MLSERNTGMCGPKQKCSVDIAAPGVGVLSVREGDDDGRDPASRNGTSMATPFVSGLIGIMKSIKYWREMLLMPEGEVGQENRYMSMLNQELP